jgi:hypothetical protein
MSVKNYYPQFPEIEYKKTSIDMPTVVKYANSLVGEYPLEVVRTAYCIFRNESANGNSGVNNNYIGLQGDNAAWTGLDLSNVIGTCIKTDGAGDTRRFICFNENGYMACFEFLCFKAQQRGMYIGAANVSNADDLAAIYQQKWVSNPKEDTPDARNDFKSLYNSSVSKIA